LGVSKAITLHQNLLNSYAEKILIQKSLFLWGDYPIAALLNKLSNQTSAAAHCFDCGGKNEPASIKAAGP
ncbi:hypothetical protein NKW46_13205, partial [Acetobacter indonesiensis]|nr:hypothetical protein [Acetobacter indonesiensis]